MLDEHPRAGDASQAAVEGVRWAAGVRLAAELLALGAGVVLARAVTPAEFGRAVVATAILTVGSVLVIQLAGAPLVGLGSVSRRQLEAAAFLAIGGSVVTAAAAVGGALALAPWTGGDAAFLVEIGAIGILAAGVTSVPQALLQRSLRFRPLFIAEIAGVVVGAAVSVALALWVGLGAEALVLGVVAAEATNAAFVCAVGVNVRPRLRRAELRGELTAFGVPASLASIAHLLFRNVDYVILGARLAPAGVGFYWRAFALGVDYQSKVSGVMLRLAFPLYAHVGNVVEIRRLRLRVAQYHAIMLFPFLTTLILVAPTLVPLVYGDRWAPAVAATQILAVAGMLAAVVTGTGPFVLALGRPRALLWFDVAVLVAYAVVVFFAAPYGLNAVAVTVTVFYFLLLLANQQFLLKGVGGIPFKTLWIDIGPPLVASAVLALGELAVLRLLSAADVAPVLQLLVAVPAGLGVYALTLRVGFPGVFKLGVELAQRILGLR